VTDGIRHYLTHIAGVKHFNADGTSRQRVIRELQPNCPLRLEEEPDNLHDPFAVRVCLQDGRQVGYLPRELAKEVFQNRQMGCWYRAVVCKANDVTASQMGGQVAEGGHYFRVDILVAEAEEYVNDHQLYEYLDKVAAELIAKLNAPPPAPVTKSARDVPAAPGQTTRIEPPAQEPVRAPFWQRVANWFGGGKSPTARRQTSRS
jgi:hypothetical protein